ncbi:hypothetical protein B0T14DRAFT_150290 [Immersiella caudata]|uniref:Uncharacterized protein n=1 Tax=Immersiella caudata TaxID=314043 RepID=A0AA39WVU7_9PEZI|nr:hypothetical protein B0T14DRAFT_150290 [Immersiella caudata]
MCCRTSGVHPRCFGIWICRKGMRPTDVGEGGWRARVAERSQFHPHSLSDHHQEKQLAAVKGSGRDARTNSVCAGPVVRSIGLHCSGLHGFRHGLDASFGGRSSELTRRGNTRAGAVFEEDRRCPTGARNVSVERHPQQRPRLAASPNRARTGIQASPTTHPNGGKGRRNTHNCPTCLGQTPARAAASRVFGDGRLHPHRHTSERASSSCWAAILLCPLRLQPASLLACVGQGRTPVQGWLSGPCCCFTPRFPDLASADRSTAMNGMADSPRASPAVARFDLSGLTSAARWFASSACYRVVYACQSSRCIACASQHRSALYLARSMSRPFVKAAAWRQWCQPPRLTLDSPPARNGIRMWGLFILVRCHPPWFPASVGLRVLWARGGPPLPSPPVTPVTSQTKKAEASHLISNRRFGTRPLDANSGFGAYSSDWTTLSIAKINDLFRHHSPCPPARWSLAGGLQTLAQLASCLRTVSRPLPPTQECLFVALFDPALQPAGHRGPADMRPGT